MEDLEKKNQFLTFHVTKAAYGIDINAVTEIIGMQYIAHVPDLPKCIKGIINLRGKIIPVMDIRERLEEEAVKYNDRTCIVVIQYEDSEVGLIVDQVQEVITIQDEKEILPLEDEIGSREFIKKVVKIEDRVYLIMDVKELITVE